MRDALTAGLLWAVWASVGFAQAPNLAALTPSGAGFFVEIRQPAQTVKAFLDGELGRRVRAFGPVQRWREQQLPGVLVVVREVSRRLDVPFEMLRDDVLGNGVSVALWPGESAGEGEHAAVHGLIVVASRTAEALERTVAGLDRALKASGELTDVEDREHAGLKYQARTVQRQGRTAVEFLAVQGALAAYSDDEGVMKRFLDLQSNAANENVFGDAVLGARLKATSPNAAAVGVFDPRPWRKVVAAELAAAEEKEDENAIRDLRGLDKVLDGIEGAVAQVDFETGLAVDVRFDLAAERLPPAVAQALSALSGAADVRWAPRGALLVLAGRADAATLMKLALANMDEGDRHDWKKIKSVAYGVFGGLSLFDDVLTRIGPNGLLFVSPREGSSAGNSSAGGEFPFDVAAAIEFRDSPVNPSDAESRPASSVVDDAMRSLLIVTAAVQNADTPDQPAVMRRTVLHGIDVAVLEDWRELPKGLAVAYTAQPTLFVVGTSVSAAVGAVRRSAADSLVEEIAPRLRSSLDPRPASQVVYLDFAAARAFLTERRGALAAWIAAEKNAPPERVERSLSQLAAVLELADSAALVQRISTDCISLTVRIVVEPSSGSNQ